MTRRNGWSCGGRGGSVAYGGDGDAALVKRSILLRSRFRWCSSHCGMCGRGGKRVATAAADLRVESVRDVVPLEKAAKAAQACPRDLRAAHLRCFGGSLAPRLSLDHDLQRPTSSAVEGARRVLGWDEW
ncbi:hypothetical protein B0H13DRAFT_2298356 [Mycena leptocephala]|nr:hypothetical protein B0H13DRAFT_2298356 [Mycena leptocephala]